MHKAIRILAISLTISIFSTICLAALFCPHAFNLDIFIPEHQKEAKSIIIDASRSAFLANKNSDQKVARIHRLQGEAFAPMIQGLKRSLTTNQKTISDRLSKIESKLPVIGPIPYFGRFASKSSDHLNFLNSYMGLSDAEPEFISIPPEYASWVKRRVNSSKTTRQRFVEQLTIDLFERSIGKNRFTNHLDRKTQPLHAHSFIYSSAPHDLYFSDVFNMIPIGVYGESLAIDLMRTSQILSELAAEDLKNLSQKINEKNSILLSMSIDSTSAPEDETHPDENTSLRGLLAGIATIHQAITMLSHEPIEGIVTGDDFVRMFMFGNSGKGFITEIAKRAPLDFIGPTGVSGIYTGDSVKLENGNYKLGNGIIEAFRLARPVENRERRAQYLRSERILGLGCPLGFTSKSGKSPLQDLAEIYYEVYLMVRSSHQNSRSSLK